MLGYARNWRYRANGGARAALTNLPHRKAQGMRGYRTATMNSRGNRSSTLPS
jgi:hypothetical protein